MDPTDIINSIDIENGARVVYSKSSLELTQPDLELNIKQIKKDLLQQKRLSKT